MKATKLGTLPKKDEESDNNKEIVFLEENTDFYKKSKDEIVCDVIENTDKYKKSGKKLIKSIKLNL